MNNKLKNVHEFPCNIMALCIIIAVIFLISLVYFLNKVCTFHPHVVSREEFSQLVEQHNDHIIKAQFKTKDNITLYGILYNARRKPSWNDTIFLYSHGNAGWLGFCLNCPSVIFLSNFGSVFIYDYRGYGINEGFPSETALYNDIKGAWNFLTTKMQIPSNRIIVFGTSLGASISSKLVADIVQQKKKLPKALLLNAPFSTIEEVAKNINPILSYLTMYNFNNIHNLKIINNKIPVCTLHSKDDIIIKYGHSLELKNKTKCDMIEIEGGHNDPIYGGKVHDYMKQILN